MQPQSVNIDTREMITATNISADMKYIRTAGFSTIGDMGGALYSRAISEPEHPGKVQSADGAWWELTSAFVMPEMFGAKCNGVSDDVPAINAAWTYVTGLGLIGVPLQLSPNKVYYADSTIQLGPINSKQRILEGNGAEIKCLASFAGYLFDGNNSDAVWAWRVELRNFTADGDYLSSTKNFLHAKNVNGLTLEGVFVQSFNLGIALDSSYAVALRGVTFRYIR